MKADAEKQRLRIKSIVNSAPHERRIRNPTKAVWNLTNVVVESPRPEIKLISHAQNQSFKANEPKLLNIVTHGLQCLLFFLAMWRQLAATDKIRCSITTVLCL